MFCRSVYILIWFFLSGLVFSGCTQSDDQRRFEDEAFTPPDGIAEMTPDGEIISEDPDDWRISPMYEALVDVDPVYPNPVPFNSYVYLNIIINSQDAVDRIDIWTFKFPDQTRSTGVILDQSMLIFGSNLVSIPSNSIAGGTGSGSGIYRILVLDGRENVITYGDVRVE